MEKSAAAAASTETQEVSGAAIGQTEDVVPTPPEAAVETQDAAPEPEVSAVAPEAAVDATGSEGQTEAASAQVQQALPVRHPSNTGREHDIRHAQL